MDLFKLEESIYNQPLDIGSLFTRLDSFANLSGNTVTIIPYSCEYDARYCFENIYGNRSSGVIWADDNIFLFHMRFGSNRLNVQRKLIEGNYFVVKHPEYAGVHIIVSVESSEFVHNALVPFIAQSYPRIYFPTIRSERLLSLLGSFKAKYYYDDLNVSQASLVSRYITNREKEKIIPSVVWPDLTLEEAFRYAEEQDGWFRSLKFRAIQRGMERSQVSIYRNGMIRCTKQFTNVIEGLALPICADIWKNMKLFEKRGRFENPTLDVRPLSIYFGYDRFKTQDDSNEFVEAMKQLDKSSVSVQHNNPYVHLSVLDYIDGSAFDVWVLDAQDIVIVPQLKGTTQAINRLVGHVFNKFAEGRVADFQLA